MKNIGPPSDDGLFLERIAALNFVRIGWILVITLGLDLLFLSLNLGSPALRMSALTGYLLGDAAAAAALLAILRRMRQASPGARWLFIVGFAAFELAKGTALYFGLLPGRTGTGYWMGALIVGVLLVLPPRLFLPLLLANHAIYAGLLLRAGWRGDHAWVEVIDGTALVTLAAVASSFLFSTRKSDYLKQRVIEQQNDELKELMAIAAHDLQTPLHGLRNLIDAALTHLQPPVGDVKPVGDALGSARDDCDRMLTLVGRLLTAHQAEHQAGFPGTPQDLAPLLSEAAARIGPVAAKKGIRLETLLPRAPAPVHIDAEALGQVLDNLLSNAVRYSPSGSVVTLALSSEGGESHIEVRDQGPGVPPGERPHLFQKFRKGAAGESLGEESHGLGLFIADRLTKALKGRLSYAGTSSSGAVFRITLSDTK